MLQVSNAIEEEQSQNMASVTVQKQELKTKLNSVTTQLAQLQAVLQTFTEMSNVNQTNKN